LGDIMQRRPVIAVGPKDLRAFIFRVESITLLRVHDLVELCCTEQKFILQRRPVIAVGPKDLRAFIFRVESITLLRVHDLAELCCTEQKSITALDSELKQWKKGSPKGVVNRLLKTAAMLKVENVVPQFAVS